MQETKRLLCIVSSMNAGGAETFLMKLYRNIDRNKFQMDFCVNSNEKGFYDDEILSLGGRIYTIPCKSENIKAFTESLGKVVSDGKYEYVLRITSNAMGFYDLKVAKENGARKCIVRSSNSSDGGSWQTRIAHIIGKLLYKKYVDVKIAPSDLAAKYTFGKQTYKNGNVFILHNAVDLGEYGFKSDFRKRIREELGIHDSTFVIGHVGRFSHQKNHEFLIKIFKEITRRHDNSKLLLVGDGELKQEIYECVDRYRLAEYVVFMGIRNDIPSILSAFDIFLFPSLYEGMPNVIIEAQASGLPCVLSDTITREADITGLLSFLSLNSSEVTWAEKALNVGKRTRIDTRNQFVKAGYDIKTVAQEFEKIIFADMG